MKEKITEIDEKRYPYTYGADYLRTIIYDELGISISRSDASHITHIFSDILYISHKDLSTKFADIFIEEKL